MHYDDREISILVEQDSWIVPYARLLCSSLTEKRFACQIVYSPDELSSGWLSFILGYTRILPADILNRFEHNLVVHESALPKGKGFAPMTWQILEGKKIIPVCLFEAVDAPDAGPIWIRDSIELSGYELCAQWRELQGQKTVDMCMRFVDEYEHLEPEPQSGEDSCYARRRPSDSQLDVERPISEQFNLLRTTDNDHYPAFFYYGQQKYILKIEKVDD